MLHLVVHIVTLRLYKVNKRHCCSPWQQIVRLENLFLYRRRVKMCCISSSLSVCVCVSDRCGSLRIFL